MTNPGAISVRLILAPIDFSDFSQNALTVAAEIASRFSAELLLVHVVPAVPDLPEGVSIFQEGKYNQNLRDVAGKRLADVAAGLAGRIKVRTQLGTANDIGMELVRIAAEDHVDMIVIATHGMTGWRQIAFGSVAKKVVEEATCPVLVLRAEQAGKDASQNAHASSS